MNQGFRSMPNTEPFVLCLVITVQGSLNKAYKGTFCSLLRRHSPPLVNLHIRSTITNRDLYGAMTHKGIDWTRWNWLVWECGWEDRTLTNRKWVCEMYKGPNHNSLKFSQCKQKSSNITAFELEGCWQMILPICLLKICELKFQHSLSGISAELCRPRFKNSPTSISRLEVSFMHRL